MTYYVDLFGFHVVKNILRKHKSASKLCKAGYVITVANTLHNPLIRKFYFSLIDWLFDPTHSKRWQLLTEWFNMASN